MTKHRRRSVSSSSSESQSFRILYSILFQHDRSSEPTEINRKALLYVSRYLRRAYRKIARERKGRGTREFFEDRSLSQRVCFHASNGSRDARVRPESWENLFLLSNIYVGTKRVPRE